MSEVALEVKCLAQGHIVVFESCQFRLAKICRMAKQSVWKSKCVF